MTVRTDLRARLQSGEQIVAPGAHDPISARLVQSLGFKTVYCGGYIYGAHRRDGDADDLTGQLAVAERVVRAVPLPVIAGTDDITVEECEYLGCSS